MKNYFKWLFSRWYFYVLILFSIIYTSALGEDVLLIPLIISSFICNAIIITIIYFIIKGIKKLSHKN